MAETWMACYRQRAVHAVPATTRSRRRMARMVVSRAVCGIGVYPLHVALCRSGLNTPR